LAATDGASGLNILDSQTRIDLLVSDVGLPGGMNGRQLADAARRRRTGLKVLFITGYSDVFTGNSGVLDEGMQVITKPFSLTAFAHKVQGILG
jgi:CheY-like chemotaxis protein